MNTTLDEQLRALQLPFIREHYQSLAQQAATEQWPPGAYLAHLINGELRARQDRALQRRLQAARLPLVKTLEQFHWDWPRNINRMHVQQLFRLDFLDTHSNVIFLGGVGLGKTHLAIALAHAACLAGHSTLFTTAVDAVNALISAHNTGGFNRELRRYLKPRLLCLDELGYLPIDKTGADLLFQIISHRYE
jgi:DNA replication protein DnaC